MTDVSKASAMMQFDSRTVREQSAVDEDESVMYPECKSIYMPRQMETRPSMRSKKNASSLILRDSQR